MEGVHEIRLFKWKLSLTSGAAIHFWGRLNTSLTILPTHLGLSISDSPVNDHSFTSVNEFSLKMLQSLACKYQLV